MDMQEEFNERMDELTELTENAKDAINRIDRRAEWAGKIVAFVRGASVFAFVVLIVYSVATLNIMGILLTALVILECVQRAFSALQDEYLVELSTAQFTFQDLYRKINKTATEFAPYVADAVEEDENDAS